DFWHILPLNVIIPELSYGELRMSNMGYFLPMQWLSRPSYFNISPTQNVFYLVNRDDDKDGQLVDHIKWNNGVLLDHVDGTDIWMAKPIWPIFNAEFGNYTWNGCQLPTQIGTRSSDCTITKNVKNSEGYLSFGPYQILPNGNYKFEVRIFSDSADTQKIGNFDVVLNNGVVLLSETIVGSNGKYTTLSGDFTIKGGSDKNRSVEIRVFVTKNHNASLQAVKIEKIKNI
ncbi:TPA: hypothetical protein ACQ98W_004575, partial [Citrobacter braakii]